MHKKFKLVCVPLIACASIASASHHVLPEFSFSKTYLKQDGLRVSSQGVWTGVAYNYEFFRPNGFYYSTDVGGMWGRVATTISSKGSDIRVQHVNRPFVGAVESRVGYCHVFQDEPRASVVPFVGLGINHVMPSAKSSSAYANGICGVFGARGFYQINPSLKIGLKAKLIYTFGYRLSADRSRAVYVKSHAKGFEVGMPLCWAPTVDDNWSFHLEPTVASVDWSHVRASMGARFGLSYRF